MNEPLKKLISAARKAYAKTPSDNRVAPSEAPLGFGTRVAASWQKKQPDTTALLEGWAWRGLAFALAVCALTAIAQETVAHSEQYPSIEVMVPPGGELF